MPLPTVRIWLEGVGITIELANRAAVRMAEGAALAEAAEEAAEEALVEGGAAFFEKMGCVATKVGVVGTVVAGGVVAEVLKQLGKQDEATSSTSVETANADEINNGNASCNTDSTSGDTHASICVEKSDNNVVMIVVTMVCSCALVRGVLWTWATSVST